MPDPTKPNDPIQKALEPKPPEPAPKPPELVQLQQAAVRDPVPFGGPSDTTLVTANGKIELDLENRVVVGTPRDPNKPVVEIPLENVRFYVRLTDKHRKTMEAQATRVAPRPPPKPAAPAQPQKKGVIKFVRGPDGRPMEVEE